jgi:C4-dicarboxylate transporter DctM subunit
MVPLALSICISFGLLFLLVASGMWVYACLGIAGIVLSYFFLGSMAMVPYIPFAAVNNWSLTAVPLFVFMGTILSISGVFKGVYTATAVLLRRIPGGLLHTNIVACALFASICGSSSATAATIGTVAFPELEKRGYDMRIGTASVAAGGMLGSLIPPSTIFIVYGSMTETSIGRLFLAGLLPGIALALTFMIVIAAWSLINPSVIPHAEKIESIRPKDLGLLICKNFVPIVLLGAGVLGGIYLGIYTPSEAGAFGCIGALILVAAFGKLTWKVIDETALTTIRITCMFLIIIVGSSLFSNALSALLIPQRLASWISGMKANPYYVLLLVTLLYLFLGCFIESLSLMIMTLSMTFPVIMAAGFDPIWFGVVMYMYMGLAIITPPVGTDLYIVTIIRGEKGSLEEVIGGILPFIIGGTIFIGILVLFPSLATWLPRQMMGR